MIAWAKYGDPRLPARFFFAQARFQRNRWSPDALISGFASALAKYSVRSTAVFPEIVNLLVPLLLGI
jgi:hypothetical protein